MAMIKCPECGKEISSSAPVCPNCGYSRIITPQSKEKTTKNALIFIVGLLLPLFLSSGAYIVFIIAGVIIEAILVLVSILSLFFSGKHIFLIMDIILFDIAVGIGSLISFILQLRSCL